METWELETHVGTGNLGTQAQLLGMETWELRPSSWDELPGFHDKRAIPRPLAACEIRKSQKSPIKSREARGKSV